MWDILLNRPVFIMFKIQKKKFKTITIMNTPTFFFSVFHTTVSNYFIEYFGFIDEICSLCHP